MNDNIPDLINVAYNREDGENLYNEIIKHFTNDKYFHRDDDAVNFCDKLLSMCVPAAAVSGISLSTVVSFAASLISKTKLYGMYDSNSIIHFIHRLLVYRLQRTNK